jgi:hypothetical protein
MKIHTLRLEGDSAKGAEISLHALADIATTLTELARRVVRLRLEGDSTLDRSSLLEDFSDIKLVGLEQGSTVLNLTASPLSNNSQLELPESIPADATALTLLEYALSDALEENKNSDYLDHRILASLGGLESIFRHGFDAFTFDNNPQYRVTKAEIRTIKKMRAEPSPQKTVIVGALDSISVSRNSLEILVDGKKIRGTLTAQKGEEYGSLLGKNVVIDASAYFKLSGNIRWLSVSHLAEASESDRVFAQLPQSSPRLLSELKPRESPSLGTNGMENVFGKWPGDETEEELLAMLKEMG